MRSCNATDLAAVQTVGNKDLATSLRRCRCRNSWRQRRRNFVQSQSPTLTLRYHEPKSQNIDAPFTMHRTVNDSSRCAGHDTSVNSTPSTQEKTDLEKEAPQLWCVCRSCGPNKEPKSQNLPLPQQSALMTPQRLHRDSVYPVRDYECSKDGRVGVHK